MGKPAMKRLVLFTTLAGLLLLPGATFTQTSSETKLARETNRNTQKHRPYHPRIISEPWRLRPIPTNPHGKIIPIPYPPTDQKGVREQGGRHKSKISPHNTGCLKGGPFDIVYS